MSEGLGMLRGIGLRGQGLRLRVLGFRVYRCEQGL